MPLLIKYFPKKFYFYNSQIFITYFIERAIIGRAKSANVFWVYQALFYHLGTKHEDHREVQDMPHLKEASFRSYGKDNVPQFTVLFLNQLCHIVISYGF